jgi:hypothetical protein
MADKSEIYLEIHLRKNSNQSKIKSKNKRISPKARDLIYQQVFGVVRKQILIL